MMSRYIIRVMVLLVVTVMTHTSLAKELALPVANTVHLAYQLQQQEKLSEAIASLEKLNPQRRYDQAFVQQVLGMFYWQNGQIEKAEQALALAVKERLLPSEQHYETVRMLADIQLSQGKSTPAIVNYEQVIDWRMSTMPLNKRQLAQLWQRLAQGYYQQQDWNQVLVALTSHVHYQGQWQIDTLSMRLGAQMAQSQWNAAVSSVEQLRSMQPKRAIWWQQLVSLHLRLEQPAQALAVLQQYQRAGFTLTQQELIVLAGLYAQQNVPEQAAKTYALLDNIATDAELKSTQARYWQMSRNWPQAILCWEQAAKLDKQYLWPYAQLLIQQQDYQQGLDVLNQIDNPLSQQHLAQAQAYFRLGNVDQAYRFATKAHQLKPSKQSERWLSYLESLKAD